MSECFASYLVPAFEPTPERFETLFNEIEMLDVPDLGRLCDLTFFSLMPDSEGSISHARHRLQREILGLLKRAKSGFESPLEGTAIAEPFTCKDELPVTDVPGVPFPYWIVAGSSWGDPISDLDEAMKLLAEEPLLTHVLAFAKEDARDGVTTGD